MRMLQLAAHRENINRINARVHDDVANYCSIASARRLQIGRERRASSNDQGVTAVSPDTWNSLL